MDPVVVAVGYGISYANVQTSTTRLGRTSGTYTTFGYDGSDRNNSITEVANGSTKATVYNRDVQGRLTLRQLRTNNVTTQTDYYAYTASGDSPDFVTDASRNVKEKYLTLPGDLLVTIRPNRTSAGVQTYSLPNLHGDTMATVNADGSLIGLHMTGPFGEVLPTTPQVNGTTTSTPWNTLDRGSFGYVGQHQKLTESALTIQPIQMGARLYIPALGRFLQVDPVQGGTDNNYAYPTDPVNDFDLDGNWSWKGIANVASWASMVPGPIGMVASGVAAASYAMAGDRKAAAMAVAGIALAAVGAGAAVKAASLAKSGSNALRLTKAVRAIKLKPLNQGGYIAVRSNRAAISGYTRHGLNQAISRDGHGVSVRAIHDAVYRPVKVVSQSGGKKKYIGNNAAVVLNKNRKIVTVYARSRKGGDGKSMKFSTEEVKMIQDAIDLYAEHLKKLGTQVGSSSLDTFEKGELIQVLSAAFSKFFLDDEDEPTANGQLLDSIIGKLDFVDNTKASMS